MAQRFGDMLKYYRMRDGLTQQSLADKLTNWGIPTSRSRIGMFESNQRRPDPETLEAVADLFNVNIDTLLGRAQQSYVPLLGRIACGSPILADGNVEEYISLPSGIKADYAVTCRGESMTGAGIHDGDVVFIRQDAEVRDGQIAAVLIGEEATLKHLIRTPDGIELGADNPAHKTIVLNGPDAESARVMGLAVAYLHKLV